MNMEDMFESMIGINPIQNIKICQGCLYSSDDLIYELKDCILRDYTDFTKLTEKQHDKVNWLCHHCCYQLFKCKLFLSQCQTSHYILQKAATKMNADSNTLEDFLMEERKYIRKSFNPSTCSIFNLDWSKCTQESDVHTLKSNIFCFKYNDDILYEESLSHNIKTESKPDEGDMFNEKLDNESDDINCDSFGDKYDDFIDDPTSIRKSKRIVTKKILGCKNKNAKNCKIKSSVKIKVKKKRREDIKIENIQVELMHDLLDQKSVPILEENSVDGTDGIEKNLSKSKSREYSENYGFDPSLVSVVILNNEEQINQLEAIRNSTAFKSAHFKCELCTKIFLYENVMIEHQARHRAEGGQYSCPVCHLRFSVENTCSKHVISHSMQYTCLQCNKVQNTRRNMVDHLFMKHDQSDKSVKCEFCNKTYKNKKSLGKHIKLHSHIKEFKCHVCPKVFARKGELHQHLLRHSGEKLYKCDNCNKKFYSIWQTRRHQLIHSDAKEFYCKECNLFFKTQGQLNQHLRRGSKHISPDLLKFPCTICDKKFEGNLKLSLHMDRIHLKRRSHICDTCSAAFYSKTGLDTHIKSVHGGFRNPRIHMCDICGKKFGTKMTLKDHMRTHTGETPFECKFCKKRFKQHGTLYTHVKSIHLKKNESGEV